MILDCVGCQRSFQMTDEEAQPLLGRRIVCPQCGFHLRVGVSGLFELRSAPAQQLDVPAAVLDAIGSPQTPPRTSYGESLRLDQVAERLEEMLRQGYDLVLEAASRPGSAFQDLQQTSPETPALPVKEIRPAAERPSAERPAVSRPAASPARSAERPVLRLVHSVPAEELSSPSVPPGAVAELRLTTREVDETLRDDRRMSPFQPVEEPEFQSPEEFEAERQRQLERKRLLDTQPGVPVFVQASETEPAPGEEEDLPIAYEELGQAPAAAGTEVAASGARQQEKPVKPKAWSSASAGLLVVLLLLLGVIGVMAYVLITGVKF